MDEPTPPFVDRRIISMKGVVLAGGQGTRLLPITSLINKHLLPVYDRPMIDFALGALVAAGVREAVVVVRPEDVSAFQSVLSDGGRYGLSRLDYATQDRPSGIADALRFAEPFVAGERCMVLLGDNLFGRSLAPYAARFLEQSHGARVLLAPVDDPRDLGIARFADDAGHLADIVEKPAVAPSNLAVVGAYFYDREVFDVCRSLRPGPRGEVEITDVNREYIRRGTLEYDLLDGWWLDAGTFDGLHQAACNVKSLGANQPHDSREPSRHNHPRTASA